MSGYFRAIAVDYDRTLTRNARPAADVLAAVAATRNGGIKVVLVTGRILTELRTNFPDATWDSASTGATIKLGDDG